MAFETTNSNTSGNTNGRNIPANKKAIGYVNFYVKTRDGGKRKLGEKGIPLREAYGNEKTLADWLEKDPANVQVLLQSLILEYNSATPAAGSGFDLPFDDAE